MNNDLEQFSEERLQRYINQFAEDGMCDITDDEIMPLVRIALSVKQAKPTFEDWLSSRTDTIEVDCGCVTTEAFYHWLKVAYETTPQPAHTEQDDTRRMDWLCAHCVEVRDPQMYGSHAMFHAQQDSEEWNLPHHTTLREQVDAAMLAAAPKPESE